MHIVWDTLGWLRFQTNLKNYVHSCLQDCYTINENVKERWKNTIRLLTGPNSVFVTLGVT